MKKHIRFQIIAPAILLLLAGIMVLAPQKREALQTPDSGTKPIFGSGISARSDFEGATAPPSMAGPATQYSGTDEGPSTIGLEPMSLISVAGEAKSAAVRQLLAALDTSKLLAANTFDQVRGAEIGNAVVISLPGTDLRGELDSRLPTGPILHYGVTLENGLGRIVLSLNDSDKINGHVFFEGEEHVLTFSGSQSGDQGWTVQENLVCNVFCAKPGTTYSADLVGPGAELDPAPFVPTPEGDDAVDALPLLNSRPGSVDVIYLDFDGEVVTHPSWNGGATINALPHPNYTNATWVTAVWKRNAEDFAPFEVNVTTDRAVFDAAPVTQRVHCIITATNWRGSGGVAYLNSYGDGTPCWTFNLSEYSCADTNTHEVGHTLGLSHDGRNTSPKDAYYGGHGTGTVSWAPIMGAPWSDDFSPAIYENVTQWSKGEYTLADNAEDDLALITRTQNFPYRLDDKGSTRGTADILNLSGNNILDSGVIERNNDQDWFQFATTGGTATINANAIDVMSTFPDQGSETEGANLAVELGLYDSGGALIESSNTATALNASITRNLAQGVYYVRINGAARGTGVTGFTNYASIGQYTLTGSLPAAIAGPEINVLGTNNTSILDGSTFTSSIDGTNFGPAEIASVTVDRTFLIQNTGGGTLTISSLSENSSQFSIVGSPPTSIPGFSSASFTVRFAPVSAGVHNATLTIGNNDSNEGTYDFAITGLGTSGIPDDNYEQNDGRDTAYDLRFYEQTFLSSINGLGVQADDDWYQIEVTPGYTRVLVTADFVDAAGDIDIALYNAAGSVVASSTGVVDDESIDFDVSTAGIYYIRVYYGNAGNPYNLIWDDIEPATDPEIEVKGGIDFDFFLTDGATTPSASDGTDFGVADINTGLVERVFRINNIGSAPLSVSNVTVNSPQFTVIGGGATNIGPGGSSTFTVRFDPAAIAVHSATVTIGNGDADENPFTFAIRGEGAIVLVDDNYEENDTRLTAFDLSTLEQTFLSEIDGVGIQNDDDWYKIDVTPNFNRILIDCTFAHVEGDIDIALYDGAGSFVTNSNGVQDDEHIDFDVAAAGGTYYIRVYFGNAGNEYDLWWDDIQPTVPEIEVRGGLALNVSIPDGAITPNVADGTEFPNLDINGETFDRTYEINNFGTGTLSIASITTNSAEFAILPGGPTSVVPGGSATFTVRFDPSAPGIRQATVNIVSNDTDESSFDFLVNGFGTDGIPDDGYEENDTLATAFNLSANEATLLSTINGFGRQADEDWYRIQISPNFSRVVIDCLFTHTQGDIDITLHDAAGAYVAGSGGVADNEQIDFEGLGAGTYYIRVYYANAGNTYDLIWDQFPAPDDNYEENDTLATAYDLSFSETTWLSNLQGPGRQADDDWYKIDVTPGFTEVRVRCDFTHAEGDIDIQLTNAAGTALASATGTADNETIVFNVGAGGIYYIRVYYGNANNTYDLWWDDIIVGSAAPNIAYVGHSIDDDAIESSGDGDGKVDPGETIELRVDLKNFGALDATNVTGTLSTTNPNVTSISDNFENFFNMQVGRTAGTEFDFDFTTSSATPAGPIVFNLLINSDQGSWITSVTVQVTNGDDNYEENDTFATAYDLSYNEQQFLSSINFAGNQFDEDWYKIDVTPGLNRVLVDCIFIHSAGDIDITLHDAAGAFVTGSGGIVDNEHIDFTVPSAGTYYIRVYFGNQGNSYDLWWDDVVPVVPEIAVAGGPLLDVGILDGDPTPDPADGTDFGSVSTEAGPVSRTFKIANEGIADLNIGTISVNSPAFTVVPGYPTLLSSGASGTVTIQFDPSSVGSFGATVTIPNNDLDESVFDFGVIGIGYLVPLPEALEATALSWTTSGNAVWFGQTAITHDGVDAVESGNIADGQSSSMETTVNGEGLISFWWKVSSETAYDYLRFYVDGVQQPGAVEISGEVGWQQVSVPVTGEGLHTLRWTYSKDGSVSSLADAGWVDEVVFTIPLPVAVDEPSLTIATSGQGAWFGQALVSHDGIDAAQSGDVADLQSSTMTTTVVGPFNLSFWWKVSSEVGYDYLRFYVDGVQRPEAVEISGDSGWQLKTVPIPVGTHSLSWVYAKDSSLSSLADAAWVDQVTITPLTGYALWAALNVPPGKDASFDGFSLANGVQNGMAYVFGPTPLAPVGNQPSGTGKIPAPPSIPSDVDVYLDWSANGVGGLPALQAWTPIVSWVNGLPPVFLFPGFTSIVDGFVIDNGNSTPFFYRYRVLQR